MFFIFLMLCLPKKVVIKIIEGALKFKVESLKFKEAV